MKINPGKDFNVAANLTKDYVAEDFFLHAGTKIYVYPNRKSFFSFMIFVLLGDFHYLVCPIPLVAIMTEEEMERKNKTGKARLFFLGANKLLRSLPPIARKVVWSQMTRAKR